MKRGKLRIGLTQRVEVLSDRGEVRDCLDQAWADLLTACGYLPVPLPNRVEDVAGLADELDLAGAIFTGGNDLSRLPGARTGSPVRDAFESRLLAWCTDRGRPVLGVCRGMQLLVSLAGVAIEPIDDHVATRHGLEVSPSRRMPLTSRETVNSYHGFGLPADVSGCGWHAVATAPDGSVEAVAHDYLPQWGIMWHPERDPRDRRDLELIRSLFNGSKS